MPPEGGGARENEDEVEVLKVGRCCCCCCCWPIGMLDRVVFMLPRPKPEDDDDKVLLEYLGVEESGAVHAVDDALADQFTVEEEEEEEVNGIGCCDCCCGGCEDVRCNGCRG